MSCSTQKSDWDFLMEANMRASCQYGGCNVPESECSNACMVKLDPKDLDAARMILRAHTKPWADPIEFADEDPEPIGLITKAVIAVFVVVIVAAALLPVLVRYVSL